MRGITLVGRLDSRIGSFGDVVILSFDTLHVSDPYMMMELVGCRSKKRRGRGSKKTLTMRLQLQMRQRQRGVGDGDGVPFYDASTGATGKSARRQPRCESLCGRVVRGVKALLDVVFLFFIFFFYLDCRKQDAPAVTMGVDGVPSEGLLSDVDE